MQAKKLTLASLLIVVAIIGGCSTQSTITGPETNQDETFINLQQDEVNPPFAKASQTATTRWSFNAVMHRAEIEGGCWYLETEKGDKFEPYFINGETVRKEGAKIQVYGYVDETKASYCQIAPIFVIEKHAVLSNEVRDEKNQNSDKSLSANDSPDYRKQVDVTGIVSQVDYPKGCIFVKTNSGGAFELKFKSDEDIPDLSRGSVKASISGLVYPKKSSECIDGFVLEVDEFKALDNGTGLNHDGSSSLIAGPTALSERPRLMIMLQGQYGITKDGCQFLKNDEGTVELYFATGTLPKIKEGALIEVSGNYSLLTGSYCNLGQRFNVDSFKVL